MLQRFEIVGNEKDKNFKYLARYKLNKPILSTGELHWRLFITGAQWRKENTKTDKDGNEKVPVMNFNIISSMLKKHIPMKLIHLLSIVITLVREYIQVKKLILIEL